MDFLTCYAIALVYRKDKNYLFDYSELTRSRVRSDRYSTDFYKLYNSLDENARGLI